MAQGLAIFTDGELTSGRDLKGKVPRSKKKALCDVKNTLLSKGTTVGKELQKDQSGPLKPDITDILCKALAKETVEEIPIKSSLKQEGTFSIACDDDNTDAYWDPCHNPECTNSEDLWFPVRSPSEKYSDEDIKYLKQGLFTMRVEEAPSPIHFEVDELEFPPPDLDDRFMLDWIPEDSCPPSPIILTDDEQGFD